MTSIRTLKAADAKQLQDLYESSLNEMQAMILYQSLLKHMTYGIFDADILVGIIQIYARNDGTYEIGYRTKHAYQHKGYMYRGVKLGSLGVVKNIEFKIVAYLPRFFMLIFVKFYVFVYRILLYSVI